MGFINWMRSMHSANEAEAKYRESGSLGCLGGPVQDFGPSLKYNFVYKKN